MKTVEEKIIDTLRDITGMPSIKADSDFLALGLNSIKLVEFAASLSDVFQLNIEASDLFDNPSLERLGAFISSRKEVDLPVEVRHGSQQEPIAIVSAAFRLPGASNFAELRDLLLEGRTAIRKMPAERQELLGLDDQHAMHLNAGYLDGIEMFDAEVYGLSAAEAKYMDPQQRLILELASQCLLQADLIDRESKERNIGVFVGASGSEFERSMLQKGMEPRGVFATGTASSLMANRVSYTFDLQGPSCAFDTACSSSLVALHHACESLRKRECTQALVGGVNLLLSPLTSATLANAGMLSPKGSITPFDDAASGYIRGEGAVMLLLKPLSAAEKDGDPILAIIAATAARHHGHSNGLVAPMPSKQAAVIKEALACSGLQPKQIVYFETHGTGTRLGDQVEIAGLAKAFADDPPEALTIGTVKANFGHLEACAGLAGLVKLLMIFQEGRIPPLAQFRTPNSNIAWPAWLQLPQSMQDRRIENNEGACLSSFGFGGMNAHVVLQGGPQRGAPATPNPLRSSLFGIGAANAARLKQMRESLEQYLLRNQSIDLPILAAQWNRAYSQGPLRECVVLHDDIARNRHLIKCDGRHSHLRLLVDSGLNSITDYPGHLFNWVPDFGKKAEEQVSSFQEFWADFLLILPASPTDEVITACQDVMLAKIRAYSLMKSLQDAGMSWDAIDAHAENILLSLLLVDFINYEQWLNLEVLFQFVQHDLLDQELFEEQLASIYAESSGMRSLSGLTVVASHSPEPECRHWASLLTYLNLQVSAEVSAGWSITECLAETEESFVLRLASLYSAGRLHLGHLAKGQSGVFVELPNASLKARLWPEELSRKNQPASQGDSSAQLDADQVIEALLIDILDVDSASISDDARMQSDLGMDSIHWFHLVSDVSQKLKIELSRSDSTFILDQTLADFKAMVHKLQAQTHADAPLTRACENDEVDWRDYLVDAWVTDHKVEIIDIPKSFVHKHHEINVFVDSILRFRAHPHVALALMKHHDQHPFFYEHPQDHIPGLYLAEAARQCAEAFIHSLGLDQHDTKFILKSSRNQFFSFCDLHTPVIMKIQFEDAEMASPQSQAQDVNIRIDIYQGGLEKGFVEGHFTFMSSRIYKKLRQQPGREANHASV